MLAQHMPEARVWWPAGPARTAGGRPPSPAVSQLGPGTPGHAIDRGTHRLKRRSRLRSGRGCGRGRRRSRALRRPRPGRRFGLWAGRWVGVPALAGAGALEAAPGPGRRVGRACRVARRRVRRAGPRLGEQGVEGARQRRAGWRVRRRRLHERERLRQGGLPEAHRTRLRARTAPASEPRIRHSRNEVGSRWQAPTSELASLTLQACSHRRAAERRLSPSAETWMAWLSWSMRTLHNTASQGEHCRSVGWSSCIYNPAP